MRLSLRYATLVAAVLATVPYVVLKAMWLAGSTVGMTGDGEAGEMSSTRFVAGNVATVAMMLIAVAFMVLLTRPRAYRLPGWLVFVLGAGATGLLAPILLGLPLGVGIQLAVRGEIKPADDTGLAPWVFGVVYSGFGVLAVAMAVSVLTYVANRWGHLLTKPPRLPSKPAVLVGALGLLPFGSAMAWWGVRGPGGTGPQGMDQPAQRTVLVVTGVLALLAFAVPFLQRTTRHWPRLAWLVTWTGCCIAALQGPTQILLAQNAEVQPGVALIGLLAVPGSCVYGLAVRRQHASTTPAPTRAFRPELAVRSD